MTRQVHQRCPRCGRLLVPVHGHMPATEAAELRHVSPVDGAGCAVVRGRAVDVRIGSLFSGAGGLDMAVEQVFGATTAWHCEIDPAASKVLAHRWPGVPNHHDITTTDWAQVEPVDIICGGWPCQPFSLAGRRKGADDERALWPYVADTVRVVRPRFVVLENVSAVLGPEFSRVANDLAALGYDIAWTCLRASDVGAPHRRERVFILAADTSGERHGRRQDAGMVGRVHHSTQSEELQRERSRSVSSDRSAARDVTHSPRDGWDEGRPEPARLEWGSDAAVRGAGPVELLPTPRSSDCFGPGKHGDGGADLRTTVTLLPTPVASDGNDGGGRDPVKDDVLAQTVKGINRWGKYEAAIRRWESLTRPAPSPTEPNTKGNPRLAAPFSEWMMGWPAGWVTDLPISSRNDQLRIIGNGVVPQQAIAALQWLLSISEAAA